MATTDGNVIIDTTTMMEDPQTLTASSLNTQEHEMMENAEDTMSDRLFSEARHALENEPELEMLLHQTVLAPNVKTFKDAVAATISYRLLFGNTAICSLDTVRNIISSALASFDAKELGHTVKEAVCHDAMAVLRRDPACQTILEVVLFFKGFAALVCHRAARYLYFKNPKKRSMLALFFQSQASAVFGVDIHPAAQIGCGVLLDHGTSVVIGETAVVGDGCTLLHEVTLGGTGKEKGDRHPKVGQHVLIGAGSKILGNVHIGDNAKIGAGSVVLRSIPSGATAVGAPARIIGRVKEKDPASDIDEVLHDVSLISTNKKKHDKQHGKPVFRVDSTLTATTVSMSETESEVDDGDAPDCMCPFRELRLLGRNAPAGTITFCTLYKLFGSIPNVESSEIGEVYFAMDKDMVGYISRDYFTAHVVELVTRYTHVSKEQCKQVVSVYLKETVETNNHSTIQSTT